MGNRLGAERAEAQLNCASSREADSSEDNSTVATHPITRTLSHRERCMLEQGQDGRSLPDGVKLAVDFSNSRKWAIALTICLVQISMNLNTSIYPNASKGIEAEFGVSAQAARVGQAVFLVMYALGSLLWAPWSEELGRRGVMQLSLGLVNVFQIPCALAPNFATIIVGRFFGGLFSAGGSVTLGTIADLWEPEDQQLGVIVVVFASVFGASVAPIPGGLLESSASWPWIFWFQLILGGVTQLTHLLLVPETRSTVLLERAAKQQRKEGKTEQAEIIKEFQEKPDLSLRHALVIWWRPFEMFLCEPIVLWLSLLSGFSDALVFTFLEAFPILYSQWDFTTRELAAAYVPILVGYIIVALSYLWPMKIQQRMQRDEPHKLTPEARLWWLLYMVPFLFIGLLGVSWTSYGPPRTHWIAPMIFTGCFGIANYAIYQSSIDYMIASYGAYASSATAGNAFARDGLAGAASLYAVPMFNALGLQWASFLLACVSILVTIPVYVFYWKGAEIRSRSKFAQMLAGEREARRDSRK